MEKKNITLSVALAVYNEEKNLGRCLDSVAGWVDEVVIVDGGSTDSTRDIANKFNAKVIVTDNPPMFHINKQKALEGCTKMWILQLDADEVISDPLRKEIEAIIRTKDSNAPVGYFIPRKNFFLGHWLRKGGQYPDYVIRLFRNGSGKFPSKSVHEQIEIAGDVGYLKEPLLHYTYRTIGEYWKKANAYTQLTADELRSKQTKGFGSYVYFEFIKPSIIFLSLFIRHKGFVDGVYGFLFAIFSALHYPIAYQKYLRMRHEK